MSSYALRIYQQTQEKISKLSIKTKKYDALAFLDSDRNLPDHFRVYSAVNAGMRSHDCPVAIVASRKSEFDHAREAAIK